MAEKVDQDVREAAYYWMVNGEWDETAIVQAFARMKAAGRQQGLREAVEVAGEHGIAWGHAMRTPADQIAAAITALIEGEGR